MKLQEFDGQVLKVSVTKDELTEILKGQEKGTFGFIHMTTKVRMNKTGNPFFDKVIKVTKGNILLGNSYEKRVETETGIENFRPEENRVGEHVSKCVLHNEKTGKHYLQYEWFEKTLPKSEYVFDGDIIEKQLFESYMTKYTPNKYGVNFQSVTVDNIKEIHINKYQYVVEE
jgi:hypothetical protein